MLSPHRPEAAACPTTVPAAATQWWVVHQQRGRRGLCSVLGGGGLRVGGQATLPRKQQDMEVRPPQASVWAVRHRPGIYRLGLGRAAAEAVGGVGFLDLAEEGSVLAAGRSFGMVEGHGGMLGLATDISGVRLAPCSPQPAHRANASLDATSHNLAEHL
jgi:hypothetical protein